MLKKLIAVVFITLSVSCGKQTKWNVNDYGALADGKTVNTKAIQNTIDACAKAGGGTVVLEGGTFVSGTLLLKDHVTLHIKENSTLLGSSNPNDYQSIDAFVDATGQLRGKCLVGAIDAKNVAITGKGTIDGQGHLFTRAKVKETLKKLGQKEKVDEVKTNNNKALYAGGKVGNFDRPFLLRLVRVNGVQLKDIHLRQPAAWTVHFFQCTNFLVDGIDIHSHANKNNDAIDIDSSTHGEIKNCTIDSGDDAICFKSTSPKPSSDVVVKKCKIKSEWGAIKFGTESMGDFTNITIKDCFIHDTRGGGIKILSVDGANINNVCIENIEMTNVEMPIFIRLGERRLVYRDAKRQPVGTINNVTIRNVKATTRSIENSRVNPSTGFFFTGTPNHKIGSIELEDIQITLSGKGTAEDAKIVVPENETQYPEFTKLGATPAYGMYARHIKQLKTKNIRFHLKAKDQREEVVLVDVN
ncbi:glycoside hydrolase family 28 protein [Ochrovirga pacifica]|uniref:glycoside hydrolase family 28 protein n=1 Tax=Ochrovirga pacifica TaxID=1042376 RepID=UPI0002559B29|nr:glycoside hydrolase family 28 protein [Ochrovirga pacifica]